MAWLVDLIEDAIRDSDIHPGIRALVFCFEDYFDLGITDLLLFVDEKAQTFGSGFGAKRIAFDSHVAKTKMDPIGRNFAVFDQWQVLPFRISSLREKHRTKNCE